MEKHNENLLEIQSAIENCRQELKNGNLMKAYYELDMACIGVSVAKMRILKQQEKSINDKKDENKTKKSNLKSV